MVTGGDLRVQLLYGDFAVLPFFARICVLDKPGLSMRYSASLKHVYVLVSLLSPEIVS